MNLAYTEEQRNKVRSEVSLSALASSMGYTVVQKGSHRSIKEMDSIIIYDDRTWKRFSNKGRINGGSQIDFELAFGSSNTVPEAIHHLLDFINSPSYGNPVAVSESVSLSESSDLGIGSMKMPPKNQDYRRVFAYLMKSRGLSQAIVSHFAHNKLIYEEANHHNIVFCGYDPDGNIRYAGMRGTVTYGNTAFKCDVTGNDKNYGVNIVNKESDEVKVFESVIDCMSYMDLTNDYTSNKIVLGMVADNPLLQFIKDYDHIKKITFCLDNDEAGQTSIYGNYGQSENIGYKEKYENLGFVCNVEIPPRGKDWNDFLTDYVEKPFKCGQYSADEFKKKPEKQPELSADVTEDVPLFRHKCR